MYLKVRVADDLSHYLSTVSKSAASATFARLLAATRLAAPARTISTQWDPGYRLPLVVAESKKRTTYDYDASGNLQSVTEQATSDETGAHGFSATLVGTSRTRSFTYNALGQPLTAKSPRMDIDDTVSYTCDGQNNLATVTNTAKQQTKLENYDANGRAGKVTAPSGAVTEFTYYPRGWLASHSVRADGVIERIDYDGTGQLKLVTLPDGSSIGYSYDAHCLTGVADSLGNSWSTNWTYAGTASRNN